MPLGLVSLGLGKQALKILLGQAATPIKAQLTPIATGLEGAGSKSREPQGGWTGQTPMGDQHRAPLAKRLGSPSGLGLLRQVQSQLHRIHHHSGQLQQGIASQGQGE